MSGIYSIGLDYGTNSVRALVVDTADGREVATSVWNYAHGDSGVILSRDPHLARQHPADYIKGAELSIQGALAVARKRVRGFNLDQIAGIGVDTTGSTPLPVDGRGQPLAFDRRFARNPAALAWLWKDHTGVAESAEITALAREIRPQYLAKCGGTYSSEWFFSKILHCLRTSPEVFDASASWVELADFVPATLTGSAVKSDGGYMRRGSQGHVQRKLGRLSGCGVPIPAFAETGALAPAPLPTSARCERQGRRTFQRMVAAHGIARGHSGRGRCF